jgi:hypothetical protein
VKLDELIRFKESFYKYIDELSISKGKGYGSEEDTLANLKLSEVLGVCPAELSIYIRLLDKVYRLGRLLREPDIPHEGVVDTVADMVNYAIYILAILCEKGKLEKRWE